MLDQYSHVYFLKIENDSTTLLLNSKTMIFCLQKKINKENNERSESKANENFLKKGGWLVSGGFIWVNHGKNDVDLSGAPHTLRVAWCASIFLWIVIFTKKSRLGSEKWLPNSLRQTESIRRIYHAFVTCNYATLRYKN